MRSQRFLFDVKSNHADTSMHVQAEKARSANAPGKSDGGIVCAGQRMSQEGWSPSGALMRGVISESGGNSSLAGECR